MKLAIGCCIAALFLMKVEAYAQAIKNKSSNKVKSKVVRQKSLSISIGGGQSLELVQVDGGSFDMGSSSGGNDEKPIHRVTLSSYAIMKYEVTQDQWQAVMGSNPSVHKGCGSCPVGMVSWEDTQEFIQKVRSLTGVEMRLPTEAEWEYAARGGQQSRGYTYSGSSNVSEVAWNVRNSDSQTHLIGQKAPNELGIYDMSGNAWEWCGDYWFGDYSSLPSTNPLGSSVGSSRVIRGGSWTSDAVRCRSTYRGFATPSDRYDDLGFRLVVLFP